MRDLFDTIMETEEIITRKKRPARKKTADRLSLLESLSGRVKDPDSFFDLDHAVASRKSATEDLEWTQGWSGEDAQDDKDSSDFE
jgi:hypothetical protein